MDQGVGQEQNFPNLVDVLRSGILIEIKLYSNETATTVTCYKIHCENCLNRALRIGTEKHFTPKPRGFCTQAVFARRGSVFSEPDGPTVRADTGRPSSPRGALPAARETHTSCSGRNPATSERSTASQGH